MGRAVPHPAPLWSQRPHQSKESQSLLGVTKLGHVNVALSSLPGPSLQRVVLKGDSRESGEGIGMGRGPLDK